MQQCHARTAVGPKEAHRAKKSNEYGGGGEAVHGKHKFRVRITPVSDLGTGRETKQTGSEKTTRERANCVVASPRSLSPPRWNTEGLSMAGPSQDTNNQLLFFLRDQEEKANIFINTNIVYKSYLESLLGLGREQK